MPDAHVVLVGYGAIGRAILLACSGDKRAPSVRTLVVRPHQEELVREKVAPEVSVVTSVPDDATLLLECAGHDAVRRHVLPALDRGIEVGMVSTGALFDDMLVRELDDAAQRGAAQLHLLSGALGGIDALSAARLSGLQSVTYTGRKPPAAWTGTPVDEEVELASLKSPYTFYEGSARDACLRYPKNANVAATISLAGVGLDRTEVRLVADPTIHTNEHEFEAIGGFGRLQVRLQVSPLAENPKTSALTVWSALRFLRTYCSENVIDFR